MSKASSLCVSEIPQACPSAFFAEHRTETLEAIARVVDGGMYVLGSEVSAFEREFAEAFGFGGAVGVANGTDAISLALQALRIAPGDRVATVALTAIATVSGICMSGAVPVFVDIDPKQYSMSPSALERTLETIPGIKAIVVVHLYGNPADMNAIMKVTRKFGIPVVEDCAQAHGAMLDGRFAGTWGDVATFSFYPTKNLGGIGDGGMVASVNAGIVRPVRDLRQYGWNAERVSEAPGINSRLDEMQAAILRVRLPYLSAGNQRRAAVAAAYDEAFARKGIMRMEIPPGALSVYHQYVIRHQERDELRTRLAALGVLTNVHYPVPAHCQPAYSANHLHGPSGLLNTELAARQILSLPMFPELSDGQVERVIDAVCRSI